jgi:2-polyprenyl-3-methyl-5-hydroxy-6-metoxy-1,4-benzoquinol methylase
MISRALPPRVCGDDDVEAGRGPGQRAWYQWIASEVAGLSVLDVGCGLGYGLDLMSRTASEVRGQDVDPRLAGPRVRIGDLTTFATGEVDVVTAIDVIEHIDDDRAFVAQLARIARQRVIMTTPNWTAGRCQWPYHVREYTPKQLRTLAEEFGRCEMWKGTPDGTEVHRIRHATLNDLFNQLRVLPPTALVARLANAVVPRAWKIHSHLAVVITL